MQGVTEALSQTSIELATPDSDFVKSSKIVGYFSRVVSTVPNTSTLPTVVANNISAVSNAVQLYVEQTKKQQLKMAAGRQQSTVLTGADRKAIQGILKDSVKNLTKIQEAMSRL
jgi:hypothetical protein